MIFDTLGILPAEKVLFYHVRRYLDQVSEETLNIFIYFSPDKITLKWAFILTADISSFYCFFVIFMTYFPFVFSLAVQHHVKFGYPEWKRIKELSAVFTDVQQ